MKSLTKRQSTLVILTGTLLLMVGLLLSLSAQPAVASPLLQTGYPGDATPTFTVTVGAGTATATVSATATATVTATQGGTLAPPRTGTPTQLVPVTGADLTQPPDQSAVGFWIALWLVGLLLIGFGLRSRLSRR